MDMTTLALAKAYTDSQRIAGETIETVCLTDDGTILGAPFTDLIGLKVTDTIPGRYRLTTPEARPDTDSDLVLVGIDTFKVQYTTNGVLDKPVLLVIAGEAAGVFMAKYYPSYHAMMYVYDTTSDTKGLGVTLEKGWYALNAQTFATEPFDIEKYFAVCSEGFLETNATNDYVWDIFTPYESVTFTVAEENIIQAGDGDGVVVSYCNVSDLADAPMRTYIEPCFTSFRYNSTSGKLWDRRLNEDILGNTHNITIAYPTIHPIDSKFIPVMDSVTLISPNGTSYKVTVDDTGALTATPT